MFDESTRKCSKVYHNHILTLQILYYRKIMLAIAKKGKKLYPDFDNQMSRLFARAEIELKEDKDRESDNETLEKTRPSQLSCPKKSSESKLESSQLFMTSPASKKIKSNSNIVVNCDSEKSKTSKAATKTVNNSNIPSITEEFQPTISCTHRRSTRKGRSTSSLREPKLNKKLRREN